MKQQCLNCDFDRMIRDGGFGHRCKLQYKERVFPARLKLAMEGTLLNDKHDARKAAATTDRCASLGPLTAKRLAQAGLVVDCLPLYWLSTVLRRLFFSW